MATKERLHLVAPCGIDCGTCELHICGYNHELFNKLAERGIPKENLPCDGCRSAEGNCPVIGEVCETYKCASGKKVNFCYECDDFPCEKLHPAANRADVLPHNMKVFNLCTIKRVGLDAFVEESAQIKRRYYSGKMAIGKGPQL
jgi:Protein of unknown function (DUF3795)